MPIFIVILEKSLLCPIWRVLASHFQIFLDNFYEIIDLVRYNLLILPFFLLVLCMIDQNKVLRTILTDHIIIHLGLIRLLLMNHNDKQVILDIECFRRLLYAIYT